MKESKINNIEQYYLTGKKLSVSTCYKLFHTHDLRRINTTIQRKLDIVLERKWETNSEGDRYMTYWMKDEDIKKIYTDMIVDGYIKLYK